MDYDDYTNSGLTSEPDNLTEIHQLSGLPTVHESRTTESGFVIRGSRLANCVPLPATKTANRSWVWVHGYAIGCVDDNKEVIRHWLCKICYNKVTPPPISSYLLKAEKNTNRPLNHLQRFHQFDKDGNKLHQIGSKKRKGESLEGWALQHEAHHTVFDEEGWKSAYCRWIASSGISLRQASSDDLRALLCFQNPRLKKLVPQSHVTTRTWMVAEFAKHKQRIMDSIASARSKVTISFDGWKANNDVLDLLGVVAHYIGDDYKVHNVVLAMRNTLGSHTGANIADLLFDVLKDYQINGSQIAFFAADNATNNDTALEHLAERVTLHPLQSRLRCAGHIFNLVCTAILFGVDEAAVEDAQYDFSQQQQTDDSGTQAVTNFEATLSHGNEQEQHLAWLRKGPVGKLYNLVTHIKSSNARILIFEGKQKQAPPDRDGEESST